MNKKQLGLGIILIAAVALVAVGIWHFRHGRIYPQTDDAYVSGETASVASRVPGVLQEVLFHDHERVEKGQVLVRLDPRDFDQAIAVAEAGLAKAQAALAEDAAMLARAKAQVAVAESQRKQASADRARFDTLGDQGSVPQRQSEEARTAAAVADAQVEAAHKAREAAAAKRGVDEKQLQRAQADLATAKLQRTYCEITAPCTGMVADKNAEGGQVVSPGQPLCQIVALSDGDMWVDANYKETQLARIRPGQHAEITVDALPGVELEGTVEALSAGTGSAFSLLPAQNASGNWVKIVQRLPVRISLAPNQSGMDRLRLGLSATVTVDTSDLKE
jgi:membrane fusion protein (multidrug efflux system)